MTKERSSEFRISLPVPTTREIEDAQSVLLHASANNRLYSVQFPDPVGKYGFRQSTHGYDSTWTVLTVELLELDLAKEKLRGAQRTGRVVKVSSYLTLDGLPAVHSVVLQLEVDG